VRTVAQQGPGPLIIGCGNTDRGDDAAGILLARRLLQLGLDAREQSGDAAALLFAFEESGACRPVIVADAVVSGARPGTVIAWDAVANPLPKETFRCSTHALGVAEAVELARALGKLPASLTIYGIEGTDFRQGAVPSAAVLAAVEELARRIQEEG